MILRSSLMWINAGVAVPASTATAQPAPAPSVPAADASTDSAPASAPQAPAPTAAAAPLPGDGAPAAESPPPVSTAAAAPLPGGAMAVPNPAPTARRAHGTIEASLGLGVLRAADDRNSESESGLSFGGGVGAFLSPRLAVSLRLAGTVGNVDGARVSIGVIGPAAQYFIDDHLWLGAGFGLGFVRIETRNGTAREDDLGIDLRAGYVFDPTARHALALALELTRVEIHDVSMMGLTIALGYQLQ